jgi:hypothetical protein
VELDSAAMSCAKDFCRIHAVALPVGANAGSSVLEVNLVSGFLLNKTSFFSQRINALEDGNYKDSNS